jgi:hypothetical protein
MSLKGKRSKVPAFDIYNFLIAAYQTKIYYDTDTSNYYPQDVEDSSNFINKYDSWKVVPCYQRYINKRLKIITDPEFTLIYWSKGFENYDVNAGRLLPSYPKSLMNNYFTPTEIKELCVLYLFELRIHGPRSSGIPLKTESEALTFFETNFPLLHKLIFTDDGFKFLKCIYEILLLIENDYVQSKDTIKKCIALLNNLFDNLSDKKLRNYCRANDKIGLFFMGMPHAKIYTGCIFTIFFLYYYYFLPTFETKFKFTRHELDTLKFVKTTMDLDSSIFEVDFDFRKKQTIKNKINFLYYEIKQFNKILDFYGWYSLRSILYQSMLQYYCSEKIYTLI